MRRRDFLAGSAPAVLAFPNGVLTLGGKALDLSGTPTPPAASASFAVQPSGTGTVGTAITATAAYSGTVYAQLYAGTTARGSAVQLTGGGVISLVPSIAETVTIKLTTGSGTVLATSSPVVVGAAGSGDGLAEGIYAPPDLYWTYDRATGNNPDNYARIASFFCKGFIPQTVTFGGADADRPAIQNNGIFTTTNMFIKPPADWTLTINATGVRAGDGAIVTHSAPITIHNVASGARVVLTGGGNFVSDADGPASGPGLPSNLGGIPLFVGTYASDNSGVLTDPSGLFQYAIDADGNGWLIVKVSAGSIGAHYGHYAPTIAVNGQTLIVHVWLVHDQGTLVAFAPAKSQFYTSDRIGSSLGTLYYTNTSGAGVWSIGSNPGNRVWVGQIGQVTLRTALTGTTSITALMNDPAAQISVPFTLPVAAGTTLPGTNMAYSMASNLSAYMPAPGGRGTAPTPVTAGTVSVSGMTPTKWTVEVPGSRIQELYAFNGPAPRYTIAGTGGGNATITIHHAAMRAPIDHAPFTETIRVTADDGAGTVCTGDIPVVIHWPTPGGSATVTVGGGKTYATMRDLFNAAIASPATFAGVVIQLYNDAGKNYVAGETYNNSSSPDSLRGVWPCPVHIIGMDRPGVGEAQRTVIDFIGDYLTISANGRGGLVHSGYDQIIENLLIRNVNDNDNAAAVYLIGNSTGDLTTRNCAYYNCNNGYEGGCEGQRIASIDDMVAGGGTGTISRTHNMYIGPLCEVTLVRLQSWGCLVGQLLKTRAYKTTVIDSKLVYGANGWGSSCLEVPFGGAASATGTIFQKGPQCDNNGKTLQYAFEPYNASTGFAYGTTPYDNSAVLADGCTFLNLNLPGQGQTSFGLSMGSALTGPTQAPITGVVQNSTIYGYDPAQFLEAEDTQRYNGAPFTPQPFIAPSTPLPTGSGNTTAHAYIPVEIIDPLTGVAPTAAMSPAWGFPVARSRNTLPGLFAGPLVIQLTIPANAAAGTNVVGGLLRPIDYAGNVCTGATYTLVVGGSDFQLVASGDGVQLQSRNANLGNRLIPVELSVTCTGVRQDGTTGTMTFARDGALDRPAFTVVAGTGAV